MSINWVMLSEDKQSFTPLPGEQKLYTSPPRTTLSLQSINKFPGKEPFSLQSNAGTVYLTNRRILYLPATPTIAFESFSAPLFNFFDTHVSSPFFGPNVWTAVVQPVPGGNIPPQHVAVELKMTFKDGGAFDFHSTYERIKERLQQAVYVARESGHLVGNGLETGDGRGAGGLAGVNMDAVHLEELPTYDDANAGFSPHGPPVAMSPRNVSYRRAQDRVAPPSEPPPEYEDILRDSVEDELERRLRR